MHVVYITPLAFLLFLNLIKCRMERIKPYKKRFGNSHIFIRMNKCTIEQTASWKQRWMWEWVRDTKQNHTRFCMCCLYTSIVFKAFRFAILIQRAVLRKREKKINCKICIFIALYYCAVALCVCREFCSRVFFDSSSILCFYIYSFFFLVLFENTKSPSFITPHWKKSNISGTCLFDCIA